MKLGDYVGATLVDGENGERRQGVFTEDYGNGIIEVQGQLGIYLCYKDRANVVADHDLRSDTRQFVNNMRRRHSLNWYGSTEYPHA